MELKAGERLDDLQCKGYRIIQDPKRFCFGMDAVLLCGFARIKAGERVVDLGTGTGVIPILLEAKTRAAHLTGLEIQPDSADMARRSVTYNGLGAKIDIVTGDIKCASEQLGAGEVDVVTCNPPYMINDHGLKNDTDAMTIARHEVLCTLDDVVRETAKLLKTGGRCYFIHRPFRLVEIFDRMRANGIEPKRMRLVYPYMDKEPTMVLVEGRKGGNPRLEVEKPLVIYERQGVYTQEILDIYQTED